MSKLLTALIIALCTSSAAHAEFNFNRVQAAMTVWKQCQAEGLRLAEKDNQMYLQLYGDFRGLDKVCGDKFTAVLEKGKK